MKGQGKGWKGESRRHSLARKGVSTVIDDDRRLAVNNYVARGDHKLYYDNIDAKPIDFDFGEGYGETWDLWQPSFYDMDKDELLEFIGDMYGEDYAKGKKDESHDNLVDEVQELWYESYEPMMNYAYPLGSHFEPDNSDWKKLNNTTIVEIDGEYYLALTGAGMDFSWQIVESYINLGYYPPVHFCDLPNMAGKDLKSPRNKKILECCVESLDTVSDRSDSTKDRLKDLMGGD